MIIDFHTHTYPDKIAAKTLELLSGRAGTKAFTDGTFDGLRKKTREAGVDVSVILPVATSAKQPEKINAAAALQNEEWENTRLWSFGAIHPENDNYREILNDVAGRGLKGIKLHPDYQGVFFNDIRYKRIVSYATELGLVVVTHAGTDIGLPDVVHCTPAMVEEMLDEVQPDKLVLAHMGGWQMWDEVLDRLCGRKVFFDTAFSYGPIEWNEGVPHRWELMTTEMFVNIVNKHGSEKILFGTDCPWTDPVSEVGRIRNTGLDTESIDNILGENARRLLGISV